MAAGGQRLPQALPHSVDGHLEHRPAILAQGSRRSHDWIQTGCQSASPTPLPMVQSQCQRPSGPVHSWRRRQLDRPPNYRPRLLRPTHRRSSRRTRRITWPNQDRVGSKTPRQPLPRLRTDNRRGGDYYGVGEGDIWGGHTAAKHSIGFQEHS